jgi:hypothetical protein
MPFTGRASTRSRPSATLAPDPVQRRVLLHLARPAPQEEGREPATGGTLHPRRPMQCTRSARGAGRRKYPTHADQKRNGHSPPEGPITASIHRSTQQARIALADSGAPHGAGSGSVDRTGPVPTMTRIHANPSKLRADHVAAQGSTRALAAAPAHSTRQNRCNSIRASICCYDARTMG